MSHLYAGFRGYDVTGDRALFGVGLRGADAQVALYDERARMIPVGEYAVEGPEEQFDVTTVTGNRPTGTAIATVDNVYASLPVLWRASWETNDERFRDVAVSHADRHLDRCLRPDGSTYHHAWFDPETGELTPSGR